MSKYVLRPVYGDMSLLVIEYNSGQSIKSIMDEQVGEEEYSQWYGYDELLELFKSKPNDVEALCEWYCEHLDYMDYEAV